jgi:ubiquinone/menaquinone biosynthesis C-methylase UbiE
MNGLQQKGYIGVGMEGVIARWYASSTRKTLAEFTRLAQRVSHDLPHGASVLELAPGPGYFAIELARLGEFQITGLDISRTFVEIARKNAREARVPVDFLNGNASAMPFTDSRFDFVFCRAAFKNFSDPYGALQEIHRVLKPGGRGLIIDLRRDASSDIIDREVDSMGFGAVSKMLTKLTFRHMLLKRAYDRSGFVALLARTPFRKAEVRETGISLEIHLER